MTAWGESFSKKAFTSFSASTETGFNLSARASMISLSIPITRDSALVPNFSTSARAPRSAPARLLAFALPLSASSVLNCSMVGLSEACEELSKLEKYFPHGESSRATMCMLNLPGPPA